MLSAADENAGEYLSAGCALAGAGNSFLATADVVRHKDLVTPTVLNAS